MTARECIVRLDGQKYNTYTQEEKLEWLNRVEELVQKEVLARHRGPGAVGGGGLDGQLLAQAPWDEMYLRWLEAQIDYANGEYDRYNNSMAMFTAAYDGFRAWYTREHMPRGKGGFRI